MIATTEDAWLVGFRDGIVGIKLSSDEFPTEITHERLWELLQAHEAGYTDAARIRAR